MKILKEITIQKNEVTKNIKNINFRVNKKLIYFFIFI